MEVNFKKKTKRLTAGRKRSRRPNTEVENNPDEDAEEGNEIERIERSIEELREDQRLRDQILKEELVTQKPDTVAKPQKKTKTMTDTSYYGFHDPKKDGSTNQKLLTLLDGQFTGQSTTTDKDQHEELMNKYIEERLQKKRTSSNNDNTGKVDDAIAALKTAEDKLFELPEHLKANVPSCSKNNDDAVEGGMLMGNAGIAEVELPVSYVKKTEALTMRALEKNGSNLPKKLNPIGGFASSVVPGNFSTDFNRHRTDYVAELKSLAQDEQRMRGFHQAGKNKATDDQAVSSFRKYESRKLRR
ncbi:Uncharacterized conserved protein [Plasmopara halstedii]|uniref:Uncharacterized conserved protein n=1 Tax=Plasmopara halstedii TaxID=4781 RepID=A0A0P1ATF4_PLAHL|nr:Uncharacterized conserved protein [Plasmopara halstedii]CEG43988.1 Uncharacterized conserved protein [Plasmopara halstedii]|eukprot:XP_024580357.1 Uncharacterized conserved protein [Plasmopara halstedii]